MDNSKNKRHRIEFFSTQDMSIPYELKKIEDLLNSYDENNSSYDINDLFEYYNIKLYFDNKLFLNTWSDVTKEKFINKIENVFMILKTRIVGVNDSDLESLLKDIEFKYYDDF